MKKLYVGNYTFDATAGRIEVPDNIAAERLLIVTDTTINEIIYNFADTEVGLAGRFYDAQREVTVFDLAVDTVALGCQDTDSLQIYIEQPYAEIEPSESLLDPVGKFRVSNPENLIDTDFEYGLQSTKWETLQTVNNVPTVYSTSGDKPVEGIVSVETAEGSRQVRVVTTIPHNLNLGDPVSVQGLDDYQAEGFFIISGVPDAVTFFFELDVEASTTGDISGSYTSIVAAKFFEGSPLPISIIDGAQTDGQAPSTIDVITDETHGFSEGTKVYVRNTIGPKNLVIQDSAAAEAPDGRPFVDTVASFDVNVGVDNTGDTGRGIVRMKPTIAYDWEPTYVKYLEASDVDAANNQITWSNHGFNNKYTVLFNTPIHGSSVMNLLDGSVYFVEVVDANTITLHTNSALTSPVDITAYDDSFGKPRLGLCYEVLRSSGLERYTPFAESAVIEEEYVWTIGNSTNASRNFGFDLDSVFSQLGDISITQLEFRGDFGSSTEYVDLRVQNGGSFYRIGATEDSGDTSNWTVSGVFDSLDNPPLDSSNRFEVNVDPSNAVNFVVSGMSNWWELRFTFKNTGIGTPTNVNLSGADLASNPFGLGQRQPQRVIAFQGRDINSPYEASSEQFSYLPNQRENGRYGTVQAQYTPTVTSTQSNGIINVDYNNPGVTELGDLSATTSEVGESAPGTYSFFIDIESALGFDPSGGNVEIVAIEGRGDLAGSSEHIDITFPDSSTYQFQGGADTATFVRENFNKNISSLLTSQGGVTGIQLDFDVDPSVNYSPGIPNGDYWQIRLVVESDVEPQIYYVMADILTADRNTIFSPSHGIPSGQEASVTIDATDYSNGQRFAFSNSIGNKTTINAQSFPVVVTSVSPDIFKIQLNQSPFTDDILEFPENFTLTYQVENEAFNTVYINNHKVSGTALGTYQVGPESTPIGGLTDNTEYNLVRVNDSRISFNETTPSSETAVTPAVGAANNNTVTEFIDFETALGIQPSAASIQQIEFRGDFGAESEYVLLRFDNGDEVFVGQRNGSDSSVFQPEETFGIKNVTDLLVTDSGTGNIGINVEFDPTSQVNFAPGGMSNYWEIRFTISGDSGTVVLSSAGSGSQTFTIQNQEGAYDGVYEMTSIPSPNEFILDSAFEIPAREYPFTSSDVNVNVITFGSTHNLITGEKIDYDENGNTPMLDTNVSDYYVIVVDETSIKIADSFLSAINNVNIPVTTSTGTHFLRSSNVIKSTSGPGSVSVVTGENVITGSGTNFFNVFKRFDTVWVEVDGFAQPFTVDTITTDERMTIFETIPADASDVTYYYATQIILRPDGYSLHKPFDGGVDITAGTSPDSKIVRQSRKYFRYQSGKGIQNSFAINFNPPKIVQTLITAAGTTARVNTQEAHNFVPGDMVRIEDAVVTTGNNPYNGMFEITAVSGPFQFEYEMPEAPFEPKAGGYPTYTRGSWTDSFVRAGMFDDQNGFFYEFDGQKLYAVRRSSTQQIAGTVDVTRGSQVISGNNTSFTSQLNRGDDIVIRGQNYRIVEISSDLRMVVQPAYRGIDAKGVKITRTVDTRTPQEEWNIDVCDGTGPTGFNLDLNRIQMGYIDYSWYGAGKIRYGFKDQNGHVRYVHEYKHNNRLNESYFRSGNLPGRYEIENGPQATASPTLFHFGTSIIMDGTFDDDKAYLFTAASRPFAFTNGDSSTITSNAVSSFQLITLEGNRVFVYAIPVSEADAAATAVGSQISVSGSSVLPEDSYVTQVDLNGTNSLIYTNYPATTTEPGGSQFPDITSGSNIIVGEQTAINLTEPLPLISVRLAPSVDSSLTGAVGEREIINRMQLALKQAGVTSNQDIELFLILNSIPSSINFNKVASPSLSQLIRHAAGDTLINGTTIYSLKASAGSVEVDLSELLELGNSILGGDGVFPTGPDLLTLAVQPQSTNSITGAAPFFVSGKISWSESQA